MVLLGPSGASPAPVANLVHSTCRRKTKKMRRFDQGRRDQNIVGFGLSLLSLLPLLEFLRMQHLATDSVRLHNELVHGSFVHYLRYAIPALVAFVVLWAKFVKD